MVAQPTGNTVRLTVVIPATDAPPTLARCVEAIGRAADPPEEVLVIDSPLGAGPAHCRNAGAWRASNPIVAFIDADVVVHPDAFTRIRQTFASDPGLAAVFGAYDDKPSGPGTVTAFRNLLHHHMHLSAAGRATTFCSALGAIRRDVLLESGGFDEHRYGRASIEDIDLGLRLSGRGARIALDPGIAGTHLKVWTLRSMVATDLLRQGHALDRAVGQPRTQLACPEPGLAPPAERGLHASDGDRREPATSCGHAGRRRRRAVDQPRVLHAVVAAPRAQGGRSGRVPARAAPAHRDRLGAGGIRRVPGPATAAAISGNFRASPGLGRAG